MYSGRGFREWEIGDIDVIKDGDTYHLFHLVLPNHDYIAHATSKDCINWKRVKNALFVGDPGEWDDDMIWTMNVVRNGHVFEMFYTGLSQKENGHLQRIGKAVSSDLFHWSKVNSAPFPIEPAEPHYESKVDNLRQWVSFRDPYIYEEDHKRFLLVCARVKTGSMSRRGCVGLIRLDGDKAILERPMFVPHVYDDVECPCLVLINERYYLIGSIREDVKVHYWYCDEFQGHYHAFHDNVLMPQGNYAARITRDNGSLLLYSFYVAGHDVETSHRYFCPPKELAVASDGKLILKSFHRWKEKIKETIYQDKFPEFIPLFRNGTADQKSESFVQQFGCLSGYEVFCFSNATKSFIWEGRIEVVGVGKCGLVLNTNEDGDGYYISLDTVQGFAQIRAWAKLPENIYKDYIFDNIQTNSFAPNEQLEYRFQLIRYGHYIEFSIDGVVTLSLVDGRFNNNMLGVYCESARVLLTDSSLHLLSEDIEDEICSHGETWDTTIMIPD